MIVIRFKDRVVRFPWQAVSSVIKDEKTVTEIEGEKVPCTIIQLHGDKIVTTADPRIILHCLKLDARTENTWEQEIDLGRYGVDDHGNVQEDVAGVAGD